jgi:hypothetical protein
LNRPIKRTPVEYLSLLNKREALFSIYAVVKGNQRLSYLGLFILRISFYTNLLFDNLQVDLHVGTYPLHPLKIQLQNLPNFLFILERVGLLLCLLRHLLIEGLKHLSVLNEALNDSLANGRIDELLESRSLKSIGFSVKSFYEISAGENRFLHQQTRGVHKEICLLVKDCLHFGEVPQFPHGIHHEHVQLLLVKVLEFN